MEESPRCSGGPFGSADDAALRQIAAAKGSRQECVDGEVRSDAIAESGAGGKLGPLRTVAAKDAGVEAQFTLGVYRSRIAEDGAMVSGRGCAGGEDGTGQNN